MNDLDEIEYAKPLAMIIGLVCIDNRLTPAATPKADRSIDVEFCPAATSTSYIPPVRAISTDRPLPTDL